jgi:hypothetical protein
MFNHAKYVVGIPKSSLTRTPHAIVIPKTMQHSELQGIFVNGSITSAGFFTYDEACVYVSGNSLSLNKVSVPGDEQLVARAIAHPGYAN